MRQVLNGAGKPITATSMQLMKDDMHAMMKKQVTAQMQNLTGNLLFDAFANKGPKKPQVYRRVDRKTMRSRIVSYPNGYWAKITVSDNDHVTYKLFNSGWLAKTFHKIGFRKVLSADWDAVKQRDTVEATLGATYMAIDEAIAEDMKKSKHDVFLKEMIKNGPRQPEGYRSTGHAG